MTRVQRCLVFMLLKTRGMSGVSQVLDLGIWMMNCQKICTDWSHRCLIWRVWKPEAWVGSHRYCLHIARWKCFLVLTEYRLVLNLMLFSAYFIYTSLISKFLILLLLLCWKLRIVLGVFLWIVTFGCIISSKASELAMLRWVLNFTGLICVYISFRIV
jgi:hypothetical protein